MKIHVMSQNMAEEWSSFPHEKAIMISITDPESPDAVFQNTVDLPILRLKFRDTLYDGRMTKEDAKRIYKFLKMNYKANETVVIHCHSGSSRSAGIAEAISAVYNRDPKKYTAYKEVYPNAWCRKCMMKEFMRHPISLYFGIFHRHN